MIEAKQIHMSFGDTPILRGISATFERGKTNLIIGQSGAGKTVLLKLLVGLLEPVQGQILYDGRDVTHLTQKEIRTVRMEVGMLFQGSALFDFMTVEENIRFPLDMFTNWTKKEKVDRVNYCLERVNLEGVNDKFPSEVSGGMQKRVGIARAIVLKPKFLFCDEPNSGLDPKTSILIDDLIHSITMENNITTVINTHDMNSVMEIGENIILLNKGEIAWHGSANDVLSSTNDYLQEFIFASPFLQRLRQAALDQEARDKR
ncbi:MAG: ATP-binding cassette domain-containing protein [Saprospiraceae bacterium]